jgi:hypothetical protein
MRLRTLLFALAVLPAAMLASPSALAAVSETKLEVNENCVEPDWPCWATPGSSQPALKVTIAAGGTITFVDMKTAANIAWTGTAPTCEAGVPVAPTAPKTGWEGKCTFTAPGTYKFESSTLWPEYTKYEVVVEGSAAGTTGEGGPKTGPGPGTAPAGEGPASPLSGSPKISREQRGGMVKGSLQISGAGAGGRLEVTLIATAASLGGSGHATRVVGRFVGASVDAGRRSFLVKLDAKARKVLELRGRLALKVEIRLAPVNGEATTVTRPVVLRGSQR